MSFALLAVWLIPPTHWSPTMTLLARSISRLVYVRCDCLGRISHHDLGTELPCRDACLLSPTRADAGRPITPNGCSVSSEAGRRDSSMDRCRRRATSTPSLGDVQGGRQRWSTGVTSHFEPHARDWVARTDSQRGVAKAANLFFIGVSQTTQAREIYLQSHTSPLPAPAPRHRARRPTSPCRSRPRTGRLPVDAEPQRHVLSSRPRTAALGPINTDSSLPGFAATGVPNGQYRVQVREAIPLARARPPTSSM